jgi:hypothetical protein
VELEHTLIRGHQAAEQVQPQAVFAQELIPARSVRQLVARSHNLSPLHNHRQSLLYHRKSTSLVMVHVTELRQLLRVVEMERTLIRGRLQVEQVQQLPGFAQELTLARSARRQVAL